MHTDVFFTTRAVVEKALVSSFSHLPLHTFIARSARQL
jgi:hypothetical protein